MKLTPYAEGFYAGIRYQRENILDFVSIHLDQGYMVTAEDIVDEINGQYKKDMNQQVDAMMDGSLDKLIRNLDELSYTISNIERQAQEIVTEVNKNL
jgi:2-hydroxy-3-keto-5-methylthiopentenyl-1-phosphate phosphatase